MFYTGFDATRDPQGPEICQATSSDGLHWTSVSTGDSIHGRMLHTNSNTWSTAHETSCAIYYSGKYFLYYIGYIDSGGGVFGSGAVSIGLSTSVDGVTFSNASETPVLTGSPDGLDRDALSSPAITVYQDSLVMVYAGFCYTNCGPVLSHLLAATSADGIHWKKHATPIINESQIPWASKGVAESDIVKGPDNQYYLFMTSIDEPHIIGVARSGTPFGPWDVNPSPIINADKSFSVKGAVAPAVIFENGKARLWYHGFTESEIRIGYAEVGWPIKE